MNSKDSHKVPVSSSEDFESGFVLPQGTLGLHLSNNVSGRPGSLQRRPLTSQSSSSASTSASGSSIVFSRFSDCSTSESEDSHSSIASSSMRFQDAQTQTRASTILQEPLSAGLLDDGSENFSDDEDERSSTLKADQLPPDLAEQLALSKVQAARAKESPQEDQSPVPIAGSKQWQSRTMAPSSASQNEDFEADFEIPSTLSILSLSRASRVADSKQAVKSVEAVISHRPASRSSSSWSLRSSAHARSDTSHSHASSSARKTESSDEDFFEGLELPSYLAKRGSACNTPPSSVDSKSSKKGNLQAVLKEKMAARARLFEPQSVSKDIQRTTEPVEPSANKPNAFTKHVDAIDEPFEDSFVLDNEQATTAIRSSCSRPLVPLSITRPSEKHSWNRVSNPLTSRSATARPGNTIHSSRSSSLLVEEKMMASKVDKSKASSSLGRAAGLGTLRSRPSISNLASANGPPSTSKPSTLLRKASANALADAARAAALSEDLARPNSSTAHYAQPTRASLARHQSAFATIGRSGFGSRPSAPSAPAPVLTSADSKAVLTVSPSSRFGSFSRLTRPTIASSAKSHRPTGSDPSGRTSASLGMPVPSTPSSPLKSLKITRGDSHMGLYRQPQRTHAFGDGSELDGFDDLPVNREKEKRFVKIPLRRRQSSGVTSVDSMPSTPGSQKDNSLAHKFSQPGQRERADSTYSAQPFLRKKPSDGSSLRARRNDNSAGKPATLVPPGDSSKKTGKRPGLKLIRNLSATGLSQGGYLFHQAYSGMLTLKTVQGQMTWNPILLKWEGNESSLVEFDNVIATSTRPALISPLGPLSPHNTYFRSPLAGESFDLSAKHKDASISQRHLNVSNPHGTTPSLGGVRIVGDMIFDPVKRTWLSMSADGEEELNFGDDEDDGSGQATQGDNKPFDAWAGGEEMRLRTRRSFANDWNSNASSHGDGEESNWSFEEFSCKQKEAEKRHMTEMQAWKSREIACKGGPG